MIKANLTTEQLDAIRAKREAEGVTLDGAWKDWPHSTKATKPKRSVKTSRTASYKIARIFKAGHGRLS